MTRDETTTMLRNCQKALAVWPAERCPDDFDGLPGMGRQLKHARWMVEETLGRLERDDVSEGDAARCLGFVDCVLWVQGFETIDARKGHNTGPPEGSS